MTAEAWLLLATGVLLLLAAACSALARRSGRRVWSHFVLGTRLAGSATLAAAMVQVASARGGWSHQDVQQVALALGMATLLVYLALRIAVKEDSGSPAVELVVAAIALLAGFQIRGEVAQDVCVPVGIATHFQWSLFLVGSGAVIVSVSIAVMQSVGWATAQHDRQITPARAQWPPVGAAQNLRLSLLATGGGLIVSAHSAWQSQGQLLSGDPRQVWMMATWLLSAASFLAWNLGNHRRRWSTALTAAAAIVAIVGLLAIGDIRRLPGSF